MCLKRIRVTAHGKRHTYCATGKSLRTARGPGHEGVADLGELRPADQAGGGRAGRHRFGVPACEIWPRLRDWDL